MINQVEYMEKARMFMRAAARDCAVLLYCFVFTSASLQALDEFDAAAFAAGERLYARCKACHAFEYNRTGPMHCGIMGRKAGSLDEFQFSRAMKQSGIVWDNESLDRFLLNPRKMVPGTTMGYAGIKDDQQRRLLVAYILKESVSPERCDNE